MSPALLYPLIGGQRLFMPADNTTGGKIFDGEENREEQKNEGGSASEPVGRYRISPLTLTVFRREVDGNTYHEVNLQRTYPKDDEGESFGYTSSMRPRDLRKAARLFERAADDLEGFEKQEV